jgi:hypothetical protein
MREEEGGARARHEKMAVQRSGMDGKPGWCARTCIARWRLAGRSLYAWQEEDFKAITSIISC